MTTSTHSVRRHRIRKRLAARGWNMAEAARQIGYFSEGGITYVRRVLSGHSVSAPILDRIEEALDKNVDGASRRKAKNGASQ